MPVVVAITSSVAITWLIFVTGSTALLMVHRRASVRVDTWVVIVVIALLAVFTVVGQIARSDGLSSGAALLLGAAISSVLIPAIVIAWFLRRRP